VAPFARSLKVIRVGGSAGSIPSPRHGLSLLSLPLRYTLPVPRFSLPIIWLKRFPVVAWDYAPECAEGQVFALGSKPTGFGTSIPAPACKPSRSVPAANSS
jgi:hypothetical protein